MRIMPLTADGLKWHPLLGSPFDGSPDPQAYMGLSMIPGSTKQ
jgi:hypothetical protein